MEQISDDIAMSDLRELNIQNDILQSDMLEAATTVSTPEPSQPPPVENVDFSEDAQALQQELTEQPAVSESRGQNLDIEA